MWKEHLGQSENPSSKKKRGQSIFGALQEVLAVELVRERACRERMLRQEHEGLQANARHRKIRTELRVALQYVKEMHYVKDKKCSM